MPKATLTKEQIKEIVDLRKTGHSLPEIKKITKRPSATISKYIKNVETLPEYEEILRIKQGGSKERSKKRWNEAQIKANDILGDFSDRDALIFLAGMYWGEGTKKDLNLINGDPYLIKSFIRGLILLGVKKDDVKLNFRIFSNMNKDEVVEFWTRFLDFDKKQVGWFEIVKGNGTQKLVNGMCRVRVRRGGPYFKLIMSMIDLIKNR